MWYRVAVWIKDPDIYINGYELHHFYYGVVGLIIVVLYAIFARRTKFNRFLIITFGGIAIGTICDEFLFILGGFENALYVTTILSAVVCAVIVTFLALIIREYVRSKRTAS